MAAKQETQMTLSEDIFDLETLNDMRAILRASLTDALNLCAYAARDLKGLDADKVMAALRAEFDQTRLLSSIQDNFSDAFHAARSDCIDVAGEPLTANTLPSGVAI